MSLPILSILTPGIPNRLIPGSTLVSKIYNQAFKANAIRDVEHIWLVDNCIRSIGEKRQTLVDIAQGEYLVFIDDDDDVPDFYVSKLLEGIQQKPDVITFRESVDWNGSKGIIEFGVHNQNEPFKGNGLVTKRKPWHICCWKSEIAKKCKFPNLNWGEDSPWVDQATALAKTEYFIPEIMHIYSHYDATSASSMRLRQDGI